MKTDRKEKILSQIDNPFLDEEFNKPKMLSQFFYLDDISDQLDLSVEAVTPVTLKVKVGYFDRDMALDAENQRITGVGFEPKALIFFSSKDSTVVPSWGLDDLTNQELIHVEEGTAWDNEHDYSIMAEHSSGDRLTGKVGSTNSDGFVFTWEKIGNPTGLLRVAYMALG